MRATVRPALPPDYPERIRRLRTRLGLTQQRLAELMGVSFASVNRWENGQARPSRLAWQQILQAEAMGLAAFRREGEDGPRAALASEPSAPPGQTAAAVRRDALPVLDFLGNPDAVWAVAEAERLSRGHLFNPAFATETSFIEPLPHQRIAVYEHMLPQPRLRFLLADDAGAGKTIMAGLYIREMLARRLIRRVLVVSPAGLVGNWERELRTLFRLPFRIVTGADARDGNPFLRPEGDLVVVSVDTLAGERVFSPLREAEEPYDLVVFDEAHKLSADREPDLRLRKTERYKLAEALAGASVDDPRWQLGWSARHLLLLTATPHMGKDYPYYCLWRLLEPEALATYDAFEAYPPEARRRHFLRRTKEELVHFDGRPIYPQRVTDTLSYELTQGEVSEQRLYDETTAYIRTYYNRARILNRSAARLAMTVLQRRLASSTYALLRSLERRLEKVEGYIAALRSGRLSLEALRERQRRLDERARDVLDELTADEEETLDGREQSEAAEEQIQAAVVATNLADLEAEREELGSLLNLARRVERAGPGSKFAKLREVLADPLFRDKKMIIFTEHRDTLEFLVRQLEGLGFAGRVAAIHGGMDYRAREEQVAFFRRPAAEGGATYLVATDAAGEGINLQFCWLMVNYDIPWNPARLEQRMGRIHRYGQKRERVNIVNLVAGNTREGWVLHVLLEKLERIRREMTSDKVFDVVGRLFEGVSLKHYLEAVLAGEEEAARAERELKGRLTREQVEALRERERRLFGAGGDVRRELPRLRQELELESYRRILPGYVRRFVERALPLMGIGWEGDLDGFFTLKPLSPGALDPLWPVLEAYAAEGRERITVYRRGEEGAIFLRPGEPLFERLSAWLRGRWGADARRGAVFVDPAADRPYLFHLVRVTAVRRADPALPALARDEVVAERLVGLRQEEDGTVTEVPVEHLLLLGGGTGFSARAARLVARAEELRELARAHALDEAARALADERRRALLSTLTEREDFVRRGFAYQEAELAVARARQAEKARAGDVRAKGELTRIKERQRQLAARQEESLAVLRREVELVAPGEVEFLAHALVVPSDRPDEARRRDEQVEALAMQVARAYEEGRGAEVRDVSTPERARAAGLPERPGFDLLSRRVVRSETAADTFHFEERAIEVKGRAGVGDVELTENEWARACNLREKYWLYVVYDCATPRPRLLRVQDPFGKLLAHSPGGVIIDEATVFASAEGDVM